MIQIDTKISCFIEKNNRRYNLFVRLSNYLSPITLEFADITSEIRDLLDINDIYNLYATESQLLKDMEKAHLDRFLGRPDINTNLDLLINLRMKKKHMEGKCKGSCILCNPDLGDDPFPDFTFELRVKGSKGSS